MSKVRSILSHIKNGTLFERLLNNEKYKLFKEYSVFLKSEKNYIEKKLSDKLTIRLFKKANLSQELYCYGFEEAEINFFKKYIKQGDVIIDIGANIGLFTLIAADKTGSQGKVISFEPSPQTFMWLKENISANNLENVSPFKMALSDREGSIEFFVSSEGYDAFNSVIKPSKGTNYNVENVVTTKLDSFVEKEGLLEKVALIKIDVEGFEIPLLNGGNKILSSEFAPDLVIEFTESNAKNAGVTCVDLYDAITKLGYKLYRYNKITNILLPEPRGLSYTEYKNLIATKDLKKLNGRINGE